MKKTAAVFFGGKQISLMLVAGAIIWSTTASWFTAHNFFGSRAESISYLCSFVLILIGVFWLASLKKTSSWRGKTMILVGAIASLAIVLGSCTCGNDTFRYWKMKAVSPENWHQMAGDLKTVRELVKPDDINENGRFEGRVIPTNFDKLGLRTECMGGNVGDGTDPYVVYGTQERRWGLVIGSNVFVKKRWKRVQVADDCFFYVGSDW